MEGSEPLNSAFLSLQYLCFILSGVVIKKNKRQHSPSKQRRALLLSRKLRASGDRNTFALEGSVSDARTRNTEEKSGGGAADSG